MKKIVSKLKPKNNEVEKTAGPRITNDNVALHREEILGSARKYIYPLRHSKHRLVVISVSLLSAAVVVFFTYCVLALYKLQSTSDFLYNVTRIVPFPIARIGSDFVAYENYLFEVNRYTHYYSAQQDLDFDSEAGQQQLAEFKKRALEKVINDAYVKRLAEEKNISVSNREVNDAIAILRNQNRLGASDKEFETVLRDFWGWSVSDFRRSLKQQLLTQKVISSLDTEAHQRANAAYEQLRSGRDFAELAREVSEDPSSKGNGGEYGFSIERTNRDISPIVVEELFKLKPGEYSGVIDAGYGLEILKNIEQQDAKIRAAHITFNFKDVSEYLNDLKERQGYTTYIRL